MLLELLDAAGLHCEEISYCSGVASQKVTWLMRKCTALQPLLGWAIVLPLRAFVPIVDALISRWSRTPPYSICIEAYKPRLT
jgi:hypothetical protein